MTKGRVICLRDEKKTVPVAGTVDRKYEGCDAAEIDVSAYSRIVLFRDESTFLAFLESNKHLKPIYLRVMRSIR